MTWRRKLYVWWFLLRRIPLMPFLGVKVISETKESCEVVIPRIWRNRNPFGITYFGALIAAGEMAGGMLLVQHVLDAQEFGVRIDVLIRKAEASFKRMADGPITFRCDEGILIADAIDEALLYTDQLKEIKVRSTGYNAAGKVAAVVDITWLVKVNTKR